MDEQDALSKMRMTAIQQMTPTKALDFLAQYIDLSWSCRSLDDIRNAQSLMSTLAARKLSSTQRTTLNYFIANSWMATREARANGTSPSLSWEIPELENEAISLRRALHSTGFKSLPVVRKCQILTNLAGKLSEAGRIVEAVRYWDQVVELEPRFGMAYGNRGIGLHKYAYNLYDNGHASLILYEARKSLEYACASPNIEPSARPHFQKELSKLSQVPKPKTKKANSDLGKTKEERAYRSWCLQERLFLNPLNDLGLHPLALRDVYGLPAILSKPSVLPPPVFTYFNLLKQEYVVARYLLYQGEHSDSVHFADQNTFLRNTLDYPSLSIGTEFTRLAFRSAYSILDKIAFFLRDYFKLEIEEKKVYFRSVWYLKGDKNKGLAPRFATSENWPLRGLFWLSKDLFEDEFKEVTEPDAQQLHDIRNYLEHKYLSLHQFDPQPRLRSLKTNAMHMSASEFYAKSLKVLHLSRAALMYLSMAVRVEEQKKTKRTKRTVPMVVDIYEDDWKRK